MTAKEPIGSASKNRSRVRESFKKRAPHLVPVDTNGLSCSRGSKSKATPLGVKVLDGRSNPHYLCSS